MEGNVVLTMRDISKTFPGVKALQHVDFTLRKGEIHALMGENGAGKSTLIRFLPVYMNLKMARSVWMEKTVRLLINHLRTHRTMVSVLYIRKLTFVRT